MNSVSQILGSYDPLPGSCVAVLKRDQLEDPSLRKQVGTALGDVESRPFDALENVSQEDQSKIRTLQSCLESVSQSNAGWKFMYTDIVAFFVHQVYQRAASTQHDTFYIPRKQLPMSFPYQSKLIIDRRYNLAVFLPKDTSKGGNQQPYSCYKVARRALVLDMKRGSSEICMALTTKKRYRDKSRVNPEFTNDRAAENAVFERLSLGYARRLLDYDYTRANVVSPMPVPLKRMALYELYDGDFFQLLSVNKINRHNKRLILHLMLKCAQSLEALHEAGFAHRDLKDKNILCRIGKDPDGSDWDVALCDFDFVCYVSEDRENTQDLGTVLYKGPELLLHHSEEIGLTQEGRSLLYAHQRYKIDMDEDDLRICDVFSLGLFFYILKDGAIPFFSQARQPGGIYELLSMYLQWNRRSYTTHTEHASNSHENNALESMLRQMLRQMLDINFRTRITMNKVVEMLKEMIRLEKRNMNPLLCVMREYNPAPGLTVGVIERQRLQTPPVLKKQVQRAVFNQHALPEEFFSDFSDEEKRKVSLIRTNLEQVSQNSSEWNFFHPYLVAYLIWRIFKKSAVSPADVCYVSRKDLPIDLPHRAKVIIDHRYDLILFLPKKVREVNQDSEHVTIYKIARTVLVMDLRNNIVETCMSLSTRKRSGEKAEISESVLLARASENRIGEQLDSGYPHKLLDYDYGQSARLSEEGHHLKRMALYEPYEADFHQLLQENKIDRANPKLISHLSLKCAKTLLSIHSKGFAHRDVKHKNILCRRGQNPDGSDWEVALCDLDFILCVTEERQPTKKPIKGTPLYMAPEILLTYHKTFDEVRKTTFFSTYAQTHMIDLHVGDLRVCDVYALGLFLYNLKNGKEPFSNDLSYKRADDFLEWQLTWRAGQQETDLENVSGLSSDELLDGLIYKMLDPNFKTRIELARVVELLERSVNLGSGEAQ